MTIKTLTKQRSRWMFGNIQVFWKHRDIVFNPRSGWLGMFISPTAIISVVLPLLFTSVLFIVTIENLANGHIGMLLFYSLAVTLIQLITAIIGLVLAKERLSYLLALSIFRLVYSPLKTYLLYASIITFLKGAQVGWNKLVRTNTVTYGNNR